MSKNYKANSSLLKINVLQVTAKERRNTRSVANVHLCKLSTKICQPLQKNIVPTATVMLNPNLIGLTFLALSSFPVSCQTCHSLSQQRLCGGARLLCQLSRVTSAFKPFGSKGNKLSQSSKCNNSHKRTLRAPIPLQQVHFSSLPASFTSFHTH